MKYLPAANVKVVAASLLFKLIIQEPLAATTKIIIYSFFFILYSGEAAHSQQIH